MSSAKHIETTSDVTRFRGVWVGALVAAISCVVIALTMGRGGASQGGPGPLSRTHSEAGLGCNDCHEDNKSAPAKCDTCHQGYQSLRAPHASLVASGVLLCQSCHQGHAGDEGVQRAADGTVTRYAGRSVAIPAPSARVAGLTAFVPIIPAGQCSQCHKIDSPQDPIAACLMASEKSLGQWRATLCFDEHVSVGGIRDANWEMARHAVATTARPSRRARGTRTGPLSWLGMGGLAGLGMLGLLRFRSSGARGRKHDEPVLRAPAILRLPIINSGTCLGCHACVDACPFDVLEIRHYVAVVARPAACCGLTLCEQRCPNGSLTMGDGTEIKDAVSLRDSLQAEHAPGIYLAGDVTGLPLIRNAINQGAHAMRSLQSELGGRNEECEFDVVVVGAGPAGISAALEAKALGLRYVVLEQGTVAGSIQSFPRAKLVFDQPLELPLIGNLWLEESTKEELLARWLRIVRSEKIDVREGVRVSDIDAKSDGSFEVCSLSEDGDASVFRTQRVLLAIGKRGSSRKLPIEIPDEASHRVFYSLADARAFAGQRVLVVGLGDVAMEAAIALSRQPGTEVTISHRGPDFSRGKARNIEEVQRRIQAGAVDLRMQSTIASISQGSVTLTSPKGETRVPCDGVFVLIGTSPPKDFLTRVGVLPNTADKENET